MMNSKYKNQYRFVIPALIALYISAISPVIAQEFDSTGRTEKEISRDISRKPDQVIAFSGLKKADKVLDFLGGGGYYSKLLKQVVGEEGVVVLHNHQANMDYFGDYIQQQQANGHLNQIITLTSEANDLKLGEKQFDMIFLVLGYHDFYHKDKGWDFEVNHTMQQLSAALKPNGQLLIVDHNAGKGRGMQDAQALHRIEADFAKADIEKRGFKFIKQLDILKNIKDDHSLDVYDPQVRRNTDRFVMLFEKAEK